MFIGLIGLALRKENRLVRNQKQPMNIHLFLLLNFMFVNHRQHLLQVNLNMWCRWIILVVKLLHPRTLILLWVFLVRPTLAERTRLFSTHHQKSPGIQCHTPVLSPTRCSTDMCSVGKTGRDRSDRYISPVRPVPPTSPTDRTDRSDRSIRSVCFKPARGIYIHTAKFFE